MERDILINEKIKEQIHSYYIENVIQSYKNLNRNTHDVDTYLILHLSKSGITNF